MQYQMSVTAEPDTSIERAARVRIGRAGTVRDRDRFVVDVSVEDLSTTGCMFRGEFAMELGALLTIGIAGIGMHVARVSRLVDGGAGCAFLIPLSAEDVEIATAAQTVHPGNFVQMKTTIRSAAATAHDRRADDKSQTIGLRLSRAIKIIRGKREA